RGRRHRRADVHEIELRVVARHEPAADVPAVLVRQVAPRVAVRLAGRRDRPPPPELFPRARVVRGDHARVGTALGLACVCRDTRLLIQIVAPFSSRLSLYKPPSAGDTRGWRQPRTPGAMARRAWPGRSGACRARLRSESQG